MSISEVKKSTISFQVSLNYLPAILRENKSGWLIEYYVEHPAEHNLV